jgi:ABC-type polysaccharide/polyol phosphate transport system ATPase subunit
VERYHNDLQPIPSPPRLLALTERTVACLILENVTVDFPIYGTQKSFRVALRSATGGLIRREGLHHERVTVRALDSVSLMLKHGDRLGIIGHNGAGKSTLLRLCAGVYEPTQGRVFIEGKVSPLFNISPGLDPDDTGYENILTCGLYLGMTHEEIARKTPDIEQFSELGEYLSLPVRTYSTGMLMRLAFAIATAIDPEILVLDEGLGAGDARFAERAKRRVDDLVGRSSIMIFASHSEDLILSMCNRSILLQSGKIVASGEVHEVMDTYRKLNQNGQAT